MEAVFDAADCYPYKGKDRTDYYERFIGSHEDNVDSEKYRYQKILADYGTRYRSQALKTII
jgi:hypothetical protein